MIDGMIAAPLRNPLSTPRRGGARRPFRPDRLDRLVRLLRPARVRMSWLQKQNVPGTQPTLP